MPWKHSSLIDNYVKLLKSICYFETDSWKVLAIPAGISHVIFLPAPNFISEETTSTNRIILRIVDIMPRLRLKKTSIKTLNVFSPSIFNEFLNNKHCHVVSSSHTSQVCLMFKNLCMLWINKPNFITKLPIITWKRQISYSMFQHDLVRGTPKN